MTKDQVKYGQVQNIIRRSHALILNVKLLGADTTKAKELLDTAKTALEKDDYDSSIEYAKKSMVEVMTLKKQVKSGVAAASGPTPPSEPTMKTESVESEPKAPLASAAPVKDNKPPASVSAKGKESEVPGTGDFDPGFSYIIEENRADSCFTVFSNLAISEFEGLCICRTNPMIIRKKYDFTEKITTLWLTDRESSKEATISPSLESMIYVAEEFIDKNEKAVILLDGLEYLISNNSFNPVLRFIRRLIDKISETNSILLIGASSKAINEQELRLLERELNPVMLG